MRDAIKESLRNYLVAFCNHKKAQRKGPTQEQFELLGEFIDHIEQTINAETIDKHAT